MRPRLSSPRLPVRLILALVGLVAVVPVTAAEAPEALAVLPGAIVLHGPEAQQRVLVGLTRAGTWTSDSVTEAKLVSRNPGVARVEAGIAYPVADGTTELVAQLGDQTAVAAVTVTGMAEPWRWSFRNHVQSVLAKQGCNSGACHGALAGKGGLKLSLRGYASEIDYFALTKQASGRRVELQDPARSLLLLKPTGAVAHKGGVRMNPDSREYRVVAEWIAAGAPAPVADDPQVDRLELLPAAFTAKPGQSQQLVVRAHFTNGQVEDVTAWAKYTATNTSVAGVDEQGLVRVTGYGEGAIVAWYQHQIVIATVTAPFANAVAAEVFEEAPKRNFIDTLVLEKLASLQVPPSPRCDDATFLRRAHLDTIGVLPTAAEAEAFLADPAPDKRDRLIDALLARPEFVDYWTYQWGDVLLMNGRKLRPQALETYYKWLRAHVEANTPWDDLARDLVTSKGDSFTNGATNFFALHQNPEDMAENVAVAFLGLNINCARCHNHPLEKWTNDQYFGFANLFSRVRAKGWGGDGRNGDGQRTLYVADEGELIQPLTGKPQPPTPLDGTPLPFDDKSDRRQALANWLVSPENPYFARAIANRVWKNFFGVALVEMVDDLRVSNPASNEKLLSAAADYLAERKFDLKELMRAILQSETYQRSSDPLPENDVETRYYSRYYPRRLMAEVLLDAIVQVTGVPETFDEIAFLGADKNKTDAYPKGTRALQLRDSAVNNYFLQTFGRNPREITCDCERSNIPSMVQVLHLSNGDTLNNKLAAPNSRVSELLAASPDDPARLLDRVYLTSLSRLPRPDEQQKLLALWADTPPPERRALLEDILWGLMSSREFLFTH